MVENHFFLLRKKKNYFINLISIDYSVSYANYEEKSLKKSLLGVKICL